MTKDVLEAIRESTGMLEDLCRIVYQFRGTVPLPYHPIRFPAPYALDDRTGFGAYEEDLFTLPGLSFA